MIKIERFSAGCKAHIKKGAVYLNQLISDSELAELTVTKGELMYSINEKELKYMSAEGDKGKLSVPYNKTRENALKEKEKSIKIKAATKTAEEAALELKEAEEQKRLQEVAAKDAEMALVQATKTEETTKKLADTLETVDAKEELEKTKVGK